MAGVPGRSGGARPGAGRKKKTAASILPGAAEPTPRTRGSVWMATRARILARDGELCQCESCQASGSPLVADDVDHRVPLWEGGADEDHNLQALSSACHKIKTAAEAARRSAAKLTPPAAADSPLDFLIGVMNDINQDPRLRVRAAIAAAQYKHLKRHDGGKKDEQGATARQTAKGKFAPAAPPKLVVNNNR